MYRKWWVLSFAFSGLAALALPATLVGGPGDFSGNGYVGVEDYFYFEICFSISGPGDPPGFRECLEVFDGDGDGDVDLSDFGVFQRVRGHLPMPLRDYLGNVITAGSTAPYSGRNTCGTSLCHDDQRVSNGAWFQDGRTDVLNNIDMRDDYNDDGRYWIKSAGRYGRWGQSFQYLLAAKSNSHASQIDQPTFNWVRDCSGCHPGAGPGEFDRDGMRLYNEVTGEFGYELLGKTPDDVALDGDYTTQNYATGAVTPAPWEVTGLSGPDCLFCHRADRPKNDQGTYMTLTWRRNILAAGANLTDNDGKSVPAFAAAGTAGQGWFSTMQQGTAAGRGEDQSAHSADAAFLAGMPADDSAGGAAALTKLQIDYQVGLDNNSLMVDEQGGLALNPQSVTFPPKDLACWGCHPYGTVAGTTWFDARDIHYRKFNRLNDADPNNDIPPDKSTVCTYCHPGNLDHNVAKGNSPQLQYRNQLDWVNFRTCRNCHLKYLPNGDSNPLKHPEAPDVGHPEDPALVHIVNTRMLEVLSCQACHIPYALTPSVVFRDITVPALAATTGTGATQRYYSTDPLNPLAVDDDSRWYPGFHFKRDVDGVERIFPVNMWVTIYFGDWDQNGTPGDLTDDIIAPIYTWKVAQAVGTTHLPIVTDDDGDGRKEINRPEEILAYFEKLRGDDANGEQISANPVLVRGKRVFYADAQAPGGIGWFYHEPAEVAMDKWYPYIWSLDHNVLARDKSWGYAPNPLDGCIQCHRAVDRDSPVFDRLVLVDPCDQTGEEVYETVRDMTGLNPP